MCNCRWVCYLLHFRAMDSGDVLAIRFHVGGRFDYNGYNVNYIGETFVGLSHLDRDKISLPEVRGFLSDHVTLGEDDDVQLHWLFPGKDLNRSLRPLNDDKTCQFISDCITGNDVAEIYVDIHKSDAGAEQGEEQLDGSYPTKSSPMVNAAGDGDGQGGVDGDADWDGDVEGDSSEGFDPDEEEAKTESDEEYVDGDSSVGDEEADEFRTIASLNRVTSLF